MLRPLPPDEVTKSTRLRMCGSTPAYSRMKMGRSPPMTTSAERARAPTVDL
jgi:hypothetical protein